jgi:methylenetetrahydrofolate dehydrogenase (NADP+)/methenyltetrahydrofolate cyclohydrolase
MAAKVIDGRALAGLVGRELQETIASEVGRVGRAPRLVVVRVGDDPASVTYIAAKIKKGGELGIEVVERCLPAAVSQAGLEAEFIAAQASANVDGVILQQPIPQHLDLRRVLSMALPEKDVDGVGFQSTSARLAGAVGFLPCTPAGVITMIDWALSGMKGVPAAQNLVGMHAVVIGRSGIVGRPMAELLLGRNATVTTVHSKTRNPGEICAQADIVVAACGVPQLVKADWVKPGAIVLDVGINRAPDSNKLLGDVDFEGVSVRAGFISPVPGGVGPMTVVMLMKNVVSSWLGPRSTVQGR